MHTAKSAGETSEELAELEEELKKEPNSWLQSLLTKLKKTAVDLLNKLGFFGIMLFASVKLPKETYHLLIDSKPIV